MVEGSFKDDNKVREFAKDKDVLTVEIEHVAVETLAALEKESARFENVPIFYHNAS